MISRVRFFSSLFGAGAHIHGDKRNRSKYKNRIISINYWQNRGKIYHIANTGVARNFDWGGGGKLEKI